MRVSNITIQQGTECYHYSYDGELTVKVELKVEELMSLRNSAFRPRSTNNAEVPATRGESRHTTRLHSFPGNFSLYKKNGRFDEPILPSHGRLSHSNLSLRSCSIVLTETRRYSCPAHPLLRYYVVFRGAWKRGRELAGRYQGSPIWPSAARVDHPSSPSSVFATSTQYCRNLIATQVRLDGRNKSGGRVECSSFWGTDKAASLSEKKLPSGSLVFWDYFAFGYQEDDPFSDRRVTLA
ncbi:hypothetical protein VTO42DRAFT_8429 [Malbranchea cinnamomea]